MKLLSAISVLLLTLVLIGCDCSSGDVTGAFGPRCDDSVTDGVSGTGTGTLVISDRGNSSIRRFDGVSTLESSLATDLPLSGALTQLSRPGYLSTHPNSGELIVADEGTNAILFFSDPLTAEGNTPPDRILTGGATEMVAPVQVYVDPDTDELYVLDKGGAQILVFDSASTIEGAVAPSRRLSGNGTGLASPNAFCFKLDSEQISVLNPTEILTFDNYRSINGAPPPSGRVSGAATTFTNLSFGIYNSAGDLILTDSGSDSILTYESFVTDQTNEVPTRIIRGSNTGLTNPMQFAFSGSTIYVADGSRIAVFDELSTLEGDPFPDRFFSGTSPATTTIVGLLFP